MNKLIITSDGSHTLYSNTFREYYHSMYGAVTESKHVFIKNGLYFFKDKPVTIFEIGFGTGLNAFLTCLEANKHNRPVIYYAIEKYPLQTDDILALNYKNIVTSDKQESEIFTQLHAAEWGKLYAINANFSIYKIRSDISMYEPSFGYDLIYFDAFAPEKQPEMWSYEIFNRLFNRLKKEEFLSLIV